MMDGFGSNCVQGSGRTLQACRPLNWPPSSLSVRSGKLQLSSPYWVHPPPYLRPSWPPLQPWPEVFQAIYLLASCWLALKRSNETVLWDLGGVRVVSFGASPGSSKGLTRFLSRRSAAVPCVGMRACGHRQLEQVTGRGVFQRYGERRSGIGANGWLEGATGTLESWY